MTFIVDTNVLIDVLRGRAEAVTVVRRLLEDDDVAISALTHLELLTGARLSEQRAVATLVAAFVELPVDGVVVARASALARRHAPAHRGIDAIDAIDAIDFVIAASAQIHEAQLITRNVKDFPMFPELVSPY